MHPHEGVCEIRHVLDVLVTALLRRFQLFSRNVFVLRNVKRAMQSAVSHVVNRPIQTGVFCHVKLLALRLLLVAGSLRDQRLRLGFRDHLR